MEQFALADGLVTLEDRALAEPRTWTSENIQVRARNVSTRRDDGVAEASSVTAGAPTSARLERIRLNPVHLDAVLESTGLDLSLARLYLPPDAPAVLDRGRASASVRVQVDARSGIRAEGTGTLEDLALVAARSGEDLIRVASMTTRLSGLEFRDGGSSSRASS